jgi:hypothetical protein
MHHLRTGENAKTESEIFEGKEEYAPGEMLHGDILVMPVPGIRRDRYALLLTDDNTRFVWLFTTKTRERLHLLIKKIVNMILTQYDTRVKRLRTDNEFITAGMELLADDYGIICEPSPPYEKNFLGVAERTNRTTMDLIRALLTQAALPDILWVEAAQTGIYLKNRTPTKGVEELTTPYAKLNKRTPKGGHLRKFGCLAMAKRHHPKHKLQPRAERCILIGYNEFQNSYKLLSLERKWKVIAGHSVAFNEQEMHAWHKSKTYQDEDRGNSKIIFSERQAAILPEQKEEKSAEPDTSQKQKTQDGTNIEVQDAHEADNNNDEQKQKTQDGTNIEVQDAHEADDKNDEHEQPPPRRSTRISHEIFRNGTRH